MGSEGSCRQMASVSSEYRWFLSIDETSLSNGELYTIVTNKAAKGGKGAIVAMIDRQRRKISLQFSVSFQDEIGGK